MVEYDRIEIIDYGLSDVIFDPERVGYQPFAQEHENYEFWPGRAGFRTCERCSHAIVEIWLANEIAVQPDTLYAAVVPFSVGEQGVFLTEVTHRSTSRARNLPVGNYALLYELKLRDKSDRAYRKSEFYRFDVEDNTRGVHCRFTFVPQDSVEAQELIAWNEDSFS